MTLHDSIRPRRIWYLLPAISLIASIAAAGVGVMTLASRVREMPRVVVPGEAKVHLEAGSYTLFGESGTEIDGVVYTVQGSLSFRCAMATAGGAPVPIRSASSKVQYSWGSREGRSIFEVDIPSTGDYVLTCGFDQPDQHVVFAFGQGIGAAIVGIVVPGSILGPLAIVSFLLIFVRRRRARRRLEAAYPMTVA